jgi:hypothetical protein
VSNKQGDLSRAHESLSSQKQLEQANQGRIELLASEQAAAEEAVQAQVGGM